ncbi:LysR family transcriptional regulator [Amnibacterium setariae]|uniref:LysR family transcriptional regulator n=2 Tax=Amnibacterium setariae TaxID=2306585 RepID=A0A3A1TXA4_9MICO|nr:LysR family transcriptional regulator [Amnibacterium setariae]
MPDVPLQVVPVEDVAAALHPAVPGDPAVPAVRMVFARLPVDGADADGLHVIPLWEETPVVVAAKDHPVKVFDAVTEADLADEELYPGWDEGALDIVAAGHGIARMPQSVFRATGRKDLVARPITDAAPSRVGLVWPRSEGGPLVDEFIGIVRGRTANSSRAEAAAPADPAEPTRRRGTEQQRRATPKRATPPVQKHKQQQRHQPKPGPKQGKRHR